MVIVAFPPGEKYAVNYTTLDQYDYGQVLRIQGLKLPKTVEVHFSTQETGGTSITRVGVTKDGVTDVLIPDSVLENGDTTQNYSIFAFVYITDATSGKTEYRAKLEVKARPKPEVPGGGDNPDIFHEAVLEVRKSAEKAEEAQRQAEGWAHGREDLPERAEDNAMYYAGKASEDAKKTAQDRAEVERLTESNTQMQGEVAKDLEEVKKLSSQAQTSATNAALSEQKSEEAATRAETAQTGAETAEDNAELAAQKTGQDKTAVEQAKKLVQQMGQEVLDNKNAVDKTVQDFNLTAQQALADVNNAGQTQTERVQTAGTTAVGNIKTAQNTATQAVETAKTEAVKAVQTEGTTQTGAVTAEGEKQVQAVQTAAQEIVADREQINTNKEGVAKLKEDISRLLEDSYECNQEMWSDNTQAEQYTTSTFSGFSTSWEITEDKYVNAIYFKVRTRDVNITEIRVRIESGDFSFEKSIAVNIGTEMTEVRFPIACIIPRGTVWIGVASNQICTFMHNTNSIYNYYYWTDGDMNHLSDLKTKYGSKFRLYIKAEVAKFNLMNENIYDKTGKKEDIFDYAEKCGKSFENKYVKEKKSTNIFDKDTMSVDGSWYYFKDSIIGEGKEVVISSNEYTGNYSAISIPVIGPCEITLSSENKETYIYGYFCVNNENIANSGWVTNVKKYITNGYTINVPSGTKKVLISINGYWRDKERYPLMINLGASKLQYEPYYKYLYLDGIVSDPKVKTKVEKLDEYIGIDSPDKVCLKLPDYYDLVVGDTFELFYKGIINSAHPELYDVIVDCAKGSAYAKRFVITPTLAENLTLTVTLYGINHTIVDRKSVILRVNEKAKSPISKTNILCIGDSLTTGGIWVSELHRRITGTGGNPNADNLSNVNFIGSRQINGTGYEGYGGWTFNSYNTENVNSNTRIITCTHSKNSNDQHSVYRDTTGATWKLETIEETTIRIIAVSGEGRNFPDSGTLKWVSGGINHDDIVYTSQVEAPGNPFWDTAKNKVDFEGYASKNGVADIHYMYVLLGWNSASDLEEKYKNDVRIFINNVLSAFPNCKIVLMGLQLPARDGLGANYGATGIYSRYFDLMRHVWNLDKWYKDISLEFPNKVTTINITGQFDTENNMPESTRTVNARNSKEETYQTNGVHPDTAGYYQIADAAYRDLINKLQAS